MSRTVFITGATGLVGRRLVEDLLADGDRVIALTRSASRARSTLGEAANLSVVEGDPSAAGAWQASIDGVDAVVHLCGAGIADRRWTDAYRRTIYDSRIESTRRISEAITQAATPPAVLVTGSAIGYYGECGDSVVTEADPPADDFIARLCHDWETAAHPAAQVTRLVHLRTGIVLDDRGGPLAKMTLPFSLFVGGPIGRGRFGMSWIHWSDLQGLIRLAIDDESVEGPLNGTAPHPVSNLEFSRALGRAMGRPCWLPVPRLALRVAMGPVAEFITMSQRIRPERALSAGYEFGFEQVEMAMTDLFDGR